jgi:protein-S-isoprenylcysteine O-methyltransferase Ste14
MRILSIVSFVALIGVLVGLYALDALFAVEPIGAAVQGLAVLLMVWARITFGMRSLHAAANPTEGGIVQHGPYRFVRHPIYAAILYFIGTAVVSHVSPWTIGLAGIALAASMVRMLTEEQLLYRRYPEYAAYAAKTKRILPGVI